MNLFMLHGNASVFHPGSVYRTDGAIMQITEGIGIGGVDLVTSQAA